MNVSMPLAELQRLLADATSPRREQGTLRPAVPSTEEGARLVAQLDATQIGKAAEYWSGASR